MTTSVTTETRTMVPDPEPRPEPWPVPPAQPSPYLEAGRELFHVLDAIRDRMGLAVAVRACTELRTAAREGRIAGSTYGSQHACMACAYGTLGRITGFVDNYNPRVPGWGMRASSLSPLEEFVLECRAGRDTSETSEVLATIDGWCTQWEQDRA